MRVKVSISTHFMDIEWPGELVKDDPEIWIVDPEVMVDKFLDRYRNLKVIITASTGTNHIDLAKCAKRGIKAYSLLDNREALNEIRASSEFTLFLILAALRRANSLLHGMYFKRWDRHEHSQRGSEIYGKSIGFIGFGRIGQNIYRWTYAMGAKPMYIHDPPAGHTHTLMNVFCNSDVVVVCCALNEQTIDMIKANHIQSMRKGACLINTARGEIIVENELVRGLIARPDLIYAADVIHGMTEGRTGSALFDLGNTIITPHVAGLTVESNEKAARIALGILEEILDDDS